jgi:hypothetical protein
LKDIKESKRMSKFVRLMMRDHALLKDINCFNVMSVEQIRRRHFTGLAPSICSERLSKLHTAGFISKQRVGTLIHHKVPKNVGTVVTLTQKGLRVVQTGNNFAGNSRLKILNTAELPHDLLLVEIADKLKEKHPKIIIFTGERAGIACKTHHIVSDLIAKLDGKNWAIELELTAKSSTRYRKLMLEYLTSDFDKIIYVLGTTTIETKLARILSEFSSVSESSGRFEFKLLDEFLCDHSKLEEQKTNIIKEKTNEKCL